jgi:hypothetical protein
MNTKRLVAALLAMAGTGYCEERKAAANSEPATVCMEADPRLTGAEPLASAMFAGIGVTIDWRGLDDCPIAAGAIRVQVSYSYFNPVSHTESAPLAVARPYQGSVVVFQDRVQFLSRNGVRSVMAHVLVHEITHVLERIDRHSSTGVMKASWDNQDYFKMRRAPLPFAQEDVDLIYAGLKVRRIAAAAAVARLVDAHEGRRIVVKIQ